MEPFESWIEKGTDSEWKGIFMIKIRNKCLAYIKDKV
jgi:hypothetical protein